MESAVDINNQYEVFLKKFLTFKQNYLNLQKAYQEVIRENKILKHDIQVLEDRQKLETSNQFTLDMIKQQEVILEFLKKKDDFIDMKNFCNSLQQEVQTLRTQLQTDRSFYEKEIKSILEKTTQQVTEVRENKQAEMNEKIQQMETKYEELSRKNDALNVVLETVGIESENEIARLNLKYEQDMAQLKESKIRLESENRMLIEKLIQQEKLFKGRIKLLGRQNKESLQFMAKESRKRNFSFLQTLDEAFLNDKDECEPNSSFRSPETSYFNSEDKLLTPYVTDESLVE